MVDVVVTVTDQDRARIQQVVGALRAAGLRVDQVLDVIGQVTGAVEENQLDAPRAVTGVHPLDRSGEVRIAPPGSPVQ